LPDAKGIDKQTFSTRLKDNSISIKLSKTSLQ
jgi:hypothetical protein